MASMVSFKWIKYLGLAFIGVLVLLSISYINLLLNAYDTIKAGGNSVTKAFKSEGLLGVKEVYNNVMVTMNNKKSCPLGKRGTEVPILHTDKPHIHIGIFTRNRFPYIQATAEALGYSLERHPEFKPYVHVNVYDDASSELSIDALIKKYPFLESIVHFQTSKGWRGAGIARVFHEECVASNHDICVFGDSDMILHPDWMVQLVGNMNKTDGQLTLYNSCSHGIIECYDRLCQKHSFGAAAAAMTRELAAEYICNVPPIGPLNDAFDWKWGEYLRDTNRRIFSVNPSMAEHIGITNATNGKASQNEQSWNFNIFDLPQPLATVMYHHLESRLSSACNKTKIDIPNGWKTQFSKLNGSIEKAFFIQPPE